MISIMLVFRFDSIMCWIRIIQKVFHAVDLIMKKDMYMYMFSKSLYVLKGFFNEYVKDEFEDARSKNPSILATYHLRAHESIMRPRI